VSRSSSDPERTPVPAASGTWAEASEWAGPTIPWATVVGSETMAQSVQPSAPWRADEVRKEQMTGETDRAKVARDRAKVARDRAGNGRLRVTWLRFAVSLAAASALAACSSVAGHAASGQASSATAISAVCTQVGAALSDGPDPHTDPVGYAEAQVRPLRGIRTSDPALRSAIRALAAAYANVFAHDGMDRSVTRAVTAARKKVNAICPGAAS
jgi:hypothetical protein